jgi:alanine dehydrogenase
MSASMAVRRPRRSLVVLVGDARSGASRARALGESLAELGVWAGSQLVVKVKEPIEREYKYLRPGLVLLAYLHLAPNPKLTRALVSSGATGIAYETVEDAEGRLVLLAPMSEIAGRLAAQTGAYLLQASCGGKGTLIGGAPGVAPPQVLIIGGGVAGTNAARVAAGMGAVVTILECSPSRIRELEDRFEGRVRVLMSDRQSLQEELGRADLVIGAVLIPGARAPQVMTRRDLERLGRGAVVVDVAIDQGGCFETSRPTTHANPTYIVDGVVYSCVANMPGAMPVTSTRSLTNATFPYVQRLASGVAEAVAADAGLAKGVVVQGGQILHPPVAEVHGQTESAVA